MEIGGIGRAAVGVPESSRNCIENVSEDMNEEQKTKACEDRCSVKKNVWSGQADFQTSIANTEVVCENYNDIKKITGMPKSCLGSDYGYQVRNEMLSVMEDFYSGNLTQEELIQKIKGMCKDMRVEQVRQHHTSGYNTADNKQILHDMYTMTQKSNVSSAYAVCNSDGEKLAAQYGGVKKYNWMYYDSDYYYQWKDLRTVVQQVFDELSEEWGTESIDYEQAEAESNYQVAGGFDFNSMWQFHAFQRRVTCITDLEAVPPEDFSFFYQTNKNPTWDKNNLLESQKGYVEIRYKSQIWKSDVFFNIFADESTIFYHMDDFAKRFLLGDMDEKCMKFLSCFDIFKVSYALRKGERLWLDTWK